MNLEEDENFIQNKFGYCFYKIEHGETPIIYNLYVHVQYRRRGNAKKLLEYVINEIRKSGYKGEIAIEADPRDTALSCEKLSLFYTNLGLKVINSRDFEGTGN